MDDNILLGFFSALWLGILTSISPCPLATNIAAVSFIGKKVGSTGGILLAGFAYTFGRVLAYFSAAFLIVLSIASIPEVARFFSKYMNLILGPLLILIGLLLLNIFKLTFSSGGKLIEKVQNFALDKGIYGAVLIGFVFALAFCPISAGLFFGSLIPIAISYNSSVIIPTAYGIGTALPVIIFAFVLGFGAKYISHVYDKTTKIEYWAQRITGVVFIFVGIYFTNLYLL
ncbi:MAG: aromatic aminobenezylarsenical efflux permease ArsG family transporter [Candidatus Kapaibacterium sp.]|jgi:cytochrome c biogenesis protein CcdA|nr:aromatic aminobenezylarsenical efflux permease ArsG family transporter [Candidatus Kapabacteria bacterium]